MTSSSSSSSSSSCSIPEPPPIDKGEPVYPHVIQHLQIIKAAPEVIQIIGARREYGIAKYKQELKTEDGRNEIEDCLQEIADGIQYLTKAYIKKNANIKKLKPYIEAFTNLYNHFVTEEKKEEK